MYSKQVTCYQMPVGKLQIKIESPQIDDTFTVHSLSIIHIRSEPPGVLGDLGRKAIYFQGAGEHW